ncbi:hypothetical protein, partial [Hyphomicrobium sp.]|uniref:hypothetical protein n=1 Tax=Hyphomicrobium sp. TaxID=82 RepID=UPI0025B99A12
MIAIAQNGVPEPEDEGGGGALFTRSDNLRADARLAANMISLGVVSEQQASALLRRGFALASRSARNGDARGYAACMKIAIECAKLEQAERHKAIDKRLPDLHAVGGVVEHRVTAAELLDQTDYVEWLR